MCNPTAMEEETRQTLLDTFTKMESDSFEFKVERVSIQPGLTFSEGAMENLMWMLRAFIGGRMMYRWETTGEPPTALSVNITVNPQ